MARKKKEEEHENHERWLVSYADFITLLFAFFTILYAQSKTDAAKAQEVQRSIQKAFRSFVDFGGLIGKYSDTNEATQLLPPPIDVVPQEGAGPKETQDFIERNLEQALGEDDEKKFIEDIHADMDGVRVSLQSATFFDSGSALIREEAVPALNKIAKVIAKTKQRLIIAGYTDNIEIHTEKFPSNWELSASRASTMVRYLVTQFNVDPKRLVAVGYAAQHPLYPNTTTENRAKNRRIEIMLVTDEKKTIP